MKNVDFSSLFFSVFSPEILMYPVKNYINPINSPAKDIIKDKEKNNVKFTRSKSAFYLNNRYSIPKRLYNKYIKEISTNDGSNNLDIKYEEENKNNFDFVRGVGLCSNDESKSLNMKNNSQNNFFSRNNLTKDFIIIKTKKSNNNNYYKKIRNKTKSVEEPYKKYLFEKMKIEKIRQMKELENKYIIESKRQKQLKYENDIRTKFQGIDFSKQNKRESFIEKIIKSKKKEEKDKKKKTDKNEFDKYDVNYFLKMLDYEINEKRYMFLENTNKFIPSAKYKDFKERFRIFNWHLKENPNYSTLINYISNK